MFVAADPFPSMVNGMATKKVTITLDAAQLARVRELVEAGKASSVSGFVQHAVGVSLADIAGWGALLAQALQDTPAGSVERLSQSQSARRPARQVTRASSG